MKFTIDKKELEEAMRLPAQLAKGSQETKLRITIDKGKMLVTATNLAIDLTSRTDVRQDEEYADCSCLFYVESAWIKDLVEELPEGDIDVVVGSVSLNLDWPGGGATFPAFGEDSPFPTGLRIGQDPASPIRHVGVPRDVAMRAFGAALPFLDNDQYRAPVFWNVLFDVNENGGVTIVGTDGRVLVSYDMPGEGAGEAFRFLIPKTGVALLRGIADKDADSILLHCDGKIATASTPRYDIAIRCSEPKYPAYRSLFTGGGGNYMLRLDRRAAMQSVRRGAALAGAPDGAVAMTLSEGSGELALRVQNAQTKAVSRETLPCGWNGPDMEVAFNAEHLTNLLHGMDTDGVVLGISAPDKAVLLFPQEDGPAKGMIMPVPVPPEIKEPARKGKGAR